MKVDKRICWMVSLVTLVTSVTPMREVVAENSVADHERPAHSSLPLAIHDVELMPHGILTGQVVDAAGQPMVGKTIFARQLRSEPIRATSDREGRFRLVGLNAGLCRIECGPNVTACRCWRTNTAPPVAQKELLLTAGELVERGQRPIGDLLTGPVLFGLIIAAAIAIPIAVHNANDDAS